MHGPEQGHYKNESVFTKIITPLHIAWYRVSNPLFRVAVYFFKINENETKVVFQMIFETVAECNKIRPYAPEENEENFDKLEIELLKNVSGELKKHKSISFTNCSKFTSFKIHFLLLWRNKAKSN